MYAIYDEGELFVLSDYEPKTDEEKEVRNQKANQILESIEEVQETDENEEWHQKDDECSL